jgi:hypothetical protein
LAAFGAESKSLHQDWIIKYVYKEYCTIMATEDFEITPSLDSMDVNSHGEAPPTYDQAMFEASMGASPITQPSSSGVYPSLAAPGGPPSAPPAEANGPLTYVTFTQGTFK